MSHIDLIVDGNSLYARQWFAVQKTIDPNNFQGIKKATVATFKKFIVSFLDEALTPFPTTPTRALVCWDGESKTDKHRSVKPSEYYNGISECIEFLTSLNVAVANEKIEADDMVATAVDRSMLDDNVEKVYIVSKDKDLMQLAGEKVKYYDLKQKCILTSKAISEKFHVKRPDQISIYLAIVGDDTDGIKGIKGSGPARAKKLFELTNENDSIAEDVEIILENLKEEEKEEFLDSLDKTLLHREVSNIPYPSEFLSESLFV